MHILVVEDEEKISNLVSESLRSAGFSVDAALDGASGLALATSRPYDAIVLDIMLPKMGGMEVLQGLRQGNHDVPVIMLTARDSTEDKIKHIDAGADDYMTKPFSTGELLVRIRALLRRAPGNRADRLRIGDLEIDRMSRAVKRGTRRIDLSAKEYKLLEYLALNAGRVLSRAMILEQVWGQSFEGLTNVVDVYIRYLRNKIDTGNDKKLIKTVRGVGYLVDESGGDKSDQ
jgi:two-component system copper resistance phosphate regulon response regulator CusR